MGVSAVLSSAAAVPVTVWLVLRYAERTYVPGGQPLVYLQEAQKQEHEASLERAKMVTEARARAAVSPAEAAFGS